MEGQFVNDLLYHYIYFKWDNLFRFLNKNINLNDCFEPLLDMMRIYKS